MLLPLRATVPPAWQAGIAATTMRTDADRCHIASTSHATFFRCGPHYISLLASIIATHDCCHIVSEPHNAPIAQRRPNDTG